MESIIKEALLKHQQRQVARAAMESISPVSKEEQELEELCESLRVRVKIVGCGGGGCNTINRLVESGITGAEMYAINTDAKSLLMIHSPHKILTGKKTTKGLGAGAMPSIGEAAAKESEDDIKAALADADIIFVTCGMGGGTGTGTAPYVAKLAKDTGALTMAVVTLPFKAEGAQRMDNALYGLDRLRRACDTVIVIPNDKLLELAPRLPLDKAFKVADEVLMRIIKSITEIITKPGLVNLDFNDLRTVMAGGGAAMIGMGESDEGDRAENAVNQALKSPLLDVDIKDATGALVQVVGGTDMTLAEASKVVEILGSKINPMARIIWGAAIDPTMERTITVLLVIVGVKYNTKREALQRAARREPAIEVIEKDDDIGIDFIRK